MTARATNADAAARALACYDRVIWIAGGQAKAGGIEPLAPYFPRIAHALLIGRDAAILAQTLAAHGVPHSTPGTLECAVAAAAGLARRPGRHHRSALPGLRQLGPVRQLRGTRRPLRRPRSQRPDRLQTGEDRLDAHAQSRRHLDPGPLVVERRSLDAVRRRHSDRLRLRHDAGRVPCSGRAYPRPPATCSS